METKKNTLIVIVGPTAVGKTALALQVAKIFKTEIISADSRQIFRELSIGTAKPSTYELAEVTHHFINSHSITQTYDAAQYADDAMAALAIIFEQKNTAVLCGGSGLYIKAVCDGFDNIPSVPEEIRLEIIRQYELQGLSWLQQQMQQLDPEYLLRLDKQNPHRLIRALEVKMGTGYSLGYFQRKEKREHNFEIVKIGLELPREQLYQRIDERMDTMIQEGLFEEAEKLYPFRNHQALQTVGYQEIFDYLDGKYDRAEAIRLLKRNSRRYAKRQLTWFKRDTGISWFRPDEMNEILRSLEAQGCKSPV